MAAEADALKNMVLTFRVSELQMLLGFAGRNKSGRKTELQQRSLELLRLRSTPVQMKIKELYKSIQQGNANGLNLQPGEQSPNGEPPSPQPSASSVSSDSQQTMNYPTAHPSGSQQQRTANMYANYNPQAAAMMPVPRPMYQHSPLYSYPTNPTGMRPPHPPMNAQFPTVHPELKIKRLPFYEVMAEILKPSTLVPNGSQRLQENNFVFHLTCQQATAVAMARDTRPGIKADDANHIQLQVRFCVLESVAEQEDCFPPGVTLKVNGKIVTLPNPIPSQKAGVEPRRPPRPVNITQYAKLSPTVTNHVNVAWNTEMGRAYCVTVYLVRKLTANDLLLKLKVRSVRKAEYTRGLIRDKLNEDSDSDIATTSLRVSLVCPLGKYRMSTPCRSVSCYHLQCFDGLAYLLMNERKPTWTCPVCDKPTTYDNLVIDGYFQEVIDSEELPGDAVEVQLLQDGSWSSVEIEKEEKETQQENPECESQMILDDDDVVAADASTSSAKESSSTSTVETRDTVENTESSDPKKKAAVVDLTEESDEDQQESTTADIPSSVSSISLIPLATSLPTVAPSTVPSTSAAPSTTAPPPTAVASTSADSAPPVSQSKEPDDGDVAIIDLTDD